jgi:branched-chain amino acid transport system ATP-binding protein
MAMAGLPNPSEGLMLLDEPAAGLSPEERLDMMDRVKRMTYGGTTVLYTEHNMDAVFGVADRVLVLIDGQLVAQGTAQEVAANDVVRQRYLGQAFTFNGGAGHA